MRELKSLIVLVIVTGIIYWGVEPFAHSVMHPSVAPANFDFAAEDIDLAKDNLEYAKKLGIEKQTTSAQANLEAVTALWNDINAIDLSKGDAKRGGALLPSAGCTGCHGVEAANMPTPMDPKTASEAYGVAPPDLSDIGYLYDAKFLAALIKNPAVALKVNHKFTDENPFPMTQFFGAGGDLNQEVADLVAYFKSIAPKQMNDKDVFINACSRCHDLKYANIFADGNKQSIAQYLGTTPPDLSMYIRSRSESYLNNFLNDTQKMLPGTSMPRVGLNAKAQAQVISFMEQSGDAKKAERENLGWWIMGYFLILGVFAWLWKRKIWSQLH